MPVYDTDVIRTPNVGTTNQASVVDDLALITQQPQSDKAKDEKGLSSQVPKNLQKHHQTSMAAADDANGYYA